MRVCKCNMCGKEFNMWDEQEGFGFDHHVGYGSEFDGERVQADFCCKCFDRILIEFIIPNSKYSPIQTTKTETEWRAE